MGWAKRAGSEQLLLAVGIHPQPGKNGIPRIRRDKASSLPPRSKPEKQRAKLFLFRIAGKAEAVGNIFAAQIMTEKFPLSFFAGVCALRLVSICDIWYHDADMLSFRLHGRLIILPGKAAKAFARYLACITGAVGAGTLLAVPAAYAEFEMKPEGFSEAAVDILQGTTATASELAMAAVRDYGGGIASLSLWEGSSLLLDQDLTVSRWGLVKGDCRLSVETPGRKLSILCGDMPFAWEDTADRSCRLAIVFSPKEPLEEPLNWTVLDLAGKMGTYGKCNAEPFAFECEAEGLRNIGVAYSAEAIGEGEIGLVAEGYGDRPKGQVFSGLTIVARPLSSTMQAPEPSAAALMLAALAMLAGRRRRR